MKFILFNDYSRDICIRLDSINGWSDDGKWIKIYIDDGEAWSLTLQGSENFRKLWKELDMPTKG